MNLLFDVVPKVMKALGVGGPDDLKFLGSGANAFAWLIPNNLVLKATSAKDDAKMAQLVMRDGAAGAWIDGIVKIYDVIEVPRLGRYRYLILSEYAVTHESDDAPGDELDALEVAVSVIQGRTRERWPGGEVPPLAKRFMSELLSAVKWLMEIGGEMPPETQEELAYMATEVMDLHEHNVGLVRRGKKWHAVIFDLGQMALPHVKLAVPVIPNTARSGAA